MRALATIGLSVSLLAGCVGGADPSASDGQTTDNLAAGAAHLKIGGKSMHVSKVEVWLPAQYAASDDYYQAFISFDGPGFASGSDFALNLSNKNRGCRNDPAAGAVQQVWLRPSGTSEYLGNDGVDCGLTVSALPNRGGRLTGTFNGKMNELNGSAISELVELSFDIASPSASVTIGGVPMKVTATDLWLPTADRQHFSGFIKFEGNRYTTGTDLVIDAVDTGTTCSALGADASQMTWLRPENATDQFISAPGANCGLEIISLGNDRMIGTFTGDTTGLNGPAGVSDLRVVFDLATAQ